MLNKEELVFLYGDNESAQKAELRINALINQFETRFGTKDDITVVSAPGRTEISGNHTDHNHGCVLAGSVNLDTIAVAKKTDDNIVTLWSEGYDKPFIVDLNDLSVKEDEKGTTYSLIRGVSAVLKENGYNIGGYNAVVNSTVLKGSGLSSSAAFEVMLVAVTDSLYNGFVIPPADNAVYSQKVENIYFGKPSGLMDQTASAVGGVVFINFKNEKAQIESVPCDFTKYGYKLCVVMCGGDHEDLTSEYASITKEMKDVSLALGVNYLADTSKEEFFDKICELKGKVSDRAMLRAIHFFNETKRPQKLVECLKAEDIKGFLSVINESGTSSWKLLQNISVAGSLNQEIALAIAVTDDMLKDQGAVRVHGGGFAGTVLSFIPEQMLDKYVSLMDALFGKGATTVLNLRPRGVVKLL